jgi:hypothetical protein
MKILAIISGEYGVRHVNNLREHSPQGWTIETWRAPAVFPLIMDYPEDYLPGARGVVAAVDSEAWLPRGLARQLRGWLERMNVACATPKPLCSLTEHDYKVTRRERETYDSEVISEFARYFGQPDIRLSVDDATRTITKAEVRRDAVCGCARHVAEKLIGLSADDAEEKAGLFHHHFPCLASMVKLNDYNHDTLMHESGHLLQENLAEQLKPFKQTRYIAPGGLVDGQ